MAELVDQTALRITRGMVGMEGACRYRRVRGRIRPMRKIVVGQAQCRSISLGLHRAHRPL